MARTKFSSRIIADAGISMGDEGKGRLVFEVIQDLRDTTGQPDPVSVVMKVNGGANSGHTAGGLKFNLLPAGVIENSVAHLAIGSGVVADPRKFWWEIRPLDGKGYNILQRFVIDERTQVSDLSHRLLDFAWEYYRVNVLKETARGTTGRGITPAYQDEVGQWQIHYADFRGDRAAFARKIEQRADRALRTIEHVCRVSDEAWDGFFETLTDAELRANGDSIEAGIFQREEFDFLRFKGDRPFTLNIELLVDVYWAAGSALADNIRDVREIVIGALQNEKYVIGEFGQSYWLDKRHGFPPNVTASHTYSSEIFQSAGIPLQPVHTIGVCKAYDTKVGTHIFLTEIPDEHPLAEKLKTLEFGTSTGRQRMVGWFDAVEKGDALRYGGFQDLMINKLDALTCSGACEGAELLICVAYRKADGTLHYGVPRDDAVRGTLTPVYQQLSGWREEISDIRHFEDLPAAARRYVGVMMQSIIDVATRGGRENITPPNLRYIGVGPDPDQIIRDVPDIKALLKESKP